jgi:hypothetical protein
MEHIVLECPRSLYYDKNMGNRRLHIIENFGKWLIDLSKLGFGSMVVGTIIRGDIPHVVLLVAGGLFTLLSAGAGFWLVSFKEQ